MVISVEKRYKKETEIDNEYNKEKRQLLHNDIAHFLAARHDHPPKRFLPRVSIVKSYI